MKANGRVDALTIILGAKSAKLESMQRLILASESNSPFVRDLEKTLRDDDDDGSVFNFEEGKRKFDDDARPTKKFKVSDGEGHLAVNQLH